MFGLAFSTRLTQSYRRTVCAHMFGDGFSSLICGWNGNGYRFLSANRVALPGGVIYRSLGNNYQRAFGNCIPLGNVLKLLLSTSSDRLGLNETKASAVRKVADRSSNLHNWKLQTRCEFIILLLPSISPVCISNLISPTKRLTRRRKEFRRRDSRSSSKDVSDL